MHPKRRTTPFVNFSKRLDIKLHPDRGVVEEKPHQRVQARVLPAGGHRREAPRSDLSRAQPLRERALEVETRVRARGEAAFSEKQLSGNEALEAMATRSPMARLSVAEQQQLRRLLSKAVSAAAGSGAESYPA